MTSQRHNVFQLGETRHVAGIRVCQLRLVTGKLMGQVCTLAIENRYPDIQFSKRPVAGRLNDCNPTVASQLKCVTLELCGLSRSFCVSNPGFSRLFLEFSVRFCGCYNANYLPRLIEHLVAVRYVCR